MENNIQIVAIDQWAHIFTAYYIDAFHHFEKYGHENTTVGTVTEWTKEWLKNNLIFTKVEEKHVD